jgi:1-aminocyclopropane-1-carboxylate deaminase/D-cysteine desulfhydrase-like pyridoxal-dependent ACC family enzyme
MLLSREIDSLVRSSYPSLDIKVVVIPCVGDEVYSMKQMENLSRHLENTDHPTTYPTILKPLTEKRHHVAKGDAKSNGYFVFGEPATPILETFLEMKEEYGVYLDLLYGAPAWTLLLQRWTSEGQMNWFSNRDEDCPLRGRQLMYVHSGGLEGVSSQLTRYRHKGLVDAREIQPS